MQQKILVALVFFAVCALEDRTEEAACETCNVENLYGHVIHNECCFYFAQKSTCSGCCKFEMDLDPVTFLPKEVNQTCCAPVYKRAMTSTLWCHCGQDCAGKLTDARYPGWAYEDNFRYDVVTECSCINNDWQEHVAYGNTPAFPTLTAKPEEHLLMAAMEDVIRRKLGDYSHVN